MSTCNADGEFLCGMSRSGELDMRNVACKVATELAGWNLGVPQREVPPPNFNGKCFGLSVASNRRGSLVAITGTDLNWDGYISLHRSAGSHWVTETNSIMRSIYSGGLVTYFSVSFGLEVQMADIMPNGVANINSRVPVHVMAKGERINLAPDGTTRQDLYLDAFYCEIHSDICYRPRFVFDQKFYNETFFAPDQEDNFLPPPSLDNASTLYQPVHRALFSTFMFPLAFSLSRSGQYLALVSFNSFTIQEWQPPKDTYDINLGGTWSPSFGTKLLGLDDNNMSASILYMATSDGMGNDNQEIVIALGLVRYNL